MSVGRTMMQAMAARNWTPEQRERQRAAMQRWKPWQQSTGPQSVNGKAKASHNVWTERRHGQNALACQGSESGHARAAGMVEAVIVAFAERSLEFAYRLLSCAITVTNRMHGPTVFSLCHAAQWIKIYRADKKITIRLLSLNCASSDSTVP